MEHKECHYNGTRTDKLSEQAIRCLLDFTMKNITFLDRSSKFNDFCPDLPGDFLSYISTLSMWECDFLWNIKIDTDAFSLVDEFNKD